MDLFNHSENKLSAGVVSWLAPAALSVSSTLLPQVLLLDTDEEVALATVFSTASLAEVFHSKARSLASSRAATRSGVSRVIWISRPDGQALASAAR